MKLQVILWYAFQRVKESDLHISLFDSGYILIPTYGSYNQIWVNWKEEKTYDNLDMFLYSNDISIIIVA